LLTEFRTAAVRRYAPNAGFWKTFFSFGTTGEDISAPVAKLK